eukprot:2230510-Ditylum_brightwellii.AAC.1
MPTKPAGKKKFYCNMQGCNEIHDTKDCFELKWRAKHTKQGKTHTYADKVTYKDLNMFVNAKVTAALKKAKKLFKQQKKEKKSSCMHLTNSTHSMLKAAMTKTSQARVLPLMWTMTTAPLPICLAMTTAIAT